MDALTQAFADFVLQVGAYWMVEQVVPLYSFCWVHHQHFADDVFDDWWDLMWESYRFLSDFFKQIDDVASCEWDLSKYKFIETDTY